MSSGAFLMLKVGKCGGFEPFKGIVCKNPKKGKTRYVILYCREL